MHARNIGHIQHMHKKSHPKHKDRNRTIWKSRENQFWMLLHLFTRLKGYEQPQRTQCRHENRQGPGQVLGGRCDFRTSRVSHPPKIVIQTVIWRLRFVTCPGKNCDLPGVVLQKLWFAGQVSARKAWFGLWFKLRNHNTWLETWEFWQNGEMFPKWNTYKHHQKRSVDEITLVSYEM